ASSSSRTTTGPCGASLSPEPAPPPLLAPSPAATWSTRSASPTGSPQNARATPSSAPSRRTESSSPAPASTADTPRSGSPVHTYPPHRAGPPADAARCYGASDALRSLGRRSSSDPFRDEHAGTLQTHVAKICHAGKQPIGTGASGVPGDYHPVAAVPLVVQA